MASNLLFVSLMDNKVYCPVADSVDRSAPGRINRTQSGPAESGEVTPSVAILNPRLIDLSMRGNCWPEVLAGLTDLLWKEDRLSSRDRFLDDVKLREQEMSTYCGRLIAIPHAVSDSVLTPSLCIGRSSGLYWQTADEWVRMVFLLAIPRDDKSNQAHSSQIDILSAVAGLALEESHLQNWLDASSPEGIVTSIYRALANNNPEIKLNRRIVNE